MASLNKAILIGNLGADPELKYTGAGQAVCNLSVATSRKWKDKAGAQQEDTQWHRVTAWGATAEACAKYLAKGRSVYVEGRLQTREYEKDGQKRWTTEIIAEQVLFLGGSEGYQKRDEAPPQSGPNDDDIPF